MDSEQVAQFKVQACSCYTLARGSHKVEHAIWQTKFQIQNNERSDVTLISSVSLHLSVSKMIFSFSCLLLEVQLAFCKEQVHTCGQLEV